MALEQDLLRLEKGFWTEGGDYYRTHVDEECLLAFTEMAGVHSNEEIGCVQLLDDAAVITYEVNATRSNGEPYKALVSTGYVKRDGEWKMAFHQQTPLDVKQ